MRKILSVLFILFLVGCIPSSLEETQDLMKEGYVKLRAELQKDLGVDEYNMQASDYVTVGGKKVTLVSFNSDYVCVFDVEGQEREMKNTQDPQVVNGVELTILWRKFDASNLDGNHIKVRAKSYSPGENEYIFYLDDVKDVLGHEIKLEKLDKDGTVTLTVGNEAPLRVMEDRQEGILDIYITNVRPNYRAIASERYVILEIEQKP